MYELVWHDVKTASATSQNSQNSFIRKHNSRAELYPSAVKLESEKIVILCPSVRALAIIQNPEKQRKTFKPFSWA